MIHAVKELASGNRVAIHVTVTGGAKEATMRIQYAEPPSEADRKEVDQLCRLAAEQMGMEPSLEQ